MDFEMQFARRIGTPIIIALDWWLHTTNAAFYLAHVFFVVGAVAAATTIIVWGKT